MCRFIVYIIYIHRYTSFLTEAALINQGRICLRPDQLESEDTPTYAYFSWNFCVHKYLFSKWWFNISNKTQWTETNSMRSMPSLMQCVCASLVICLGKLCVLGCTQWLTINTGQVQDLRRRFDVKFWFLFNNCTTNIPVFQYTSPWHLLGDQIVCVFFVCSHKNNDSRLPVH